MFAITRGLIFEVSVFVFGVFEKKSPAPFLSKGNPAAFDAIPASLENETTNLDSTPPPVAEPVKESPPAVTPG